MKVVKTLILTKAELRSVMIKYCADQLNSPEVREKLMAGDYKLPKPGEWDCKTLAFKAGEAKVCDSKLWDKRTLRGVNQVQVHDEAFDQYYTIWTAPVQIPDAVKEKNTVSKNETNGTGTLTPATPTVTENAAEVPTVTENAASSAQ